MKDDEAYLRLTIDVHYELGGTPVRDLERVLRSAADHLEAEGLLSGETEASVLTCTSAVTPPDDQTLADGCVLEVLRMALDELTRLHDDQHGYTEEELGDFCRVDAGVLQSLEDVLRKPGTAFADQIERVASLSTAHLRRFDVEFLDRLSTDDVKVDGPDARAMKYQEGWFLCLFGEIDWDTFVGCSPELLRILKAAAGEKISIIRFDRDAALLPDFTDCSEEWE